MQSQQQAWQHSTCDLMDAERRLHVAGRHPPALLEWGHRAAAPVAGTQPDHAHRPELPVRCLPADHHLHAGLWRCLHLCAPRSPTKHSVIGSNDMHTENLLFTCSCQAQCDHLHELPRAHRPAGPPCRQAVQQALSLSASAGDAPRWVYFSCGAAAFTYLHLDCIDGKQARRTKSSSPLGQLFDHGEPWASG